LGKGIDVGVYEWYEIDIRAGKEYAATMHDL